MENNQVVEKPKIYQALGIISGILELGEDRYSRLLIGKQTYSVTVSPKVWKKHQPGQEQNFKAYPMIAEGKLGFRLRIVTSRESGIILKGCWEIREEEPQLVIYRNFPTRCAGITILPLIWEEAPVADGKYWEIEAKLKGDKFEVTQALGPFKPPQKYQKRKKTYENAKSDLPRPILRSDKYINAKSELPPPILKSTKDLIASLAPKAITEGASLSIDPLEAEAITETASEPSVTSEIKAIASLAPMVIEPEAKETSAIVTEAATPKTKKASSKPAAAKKSLSLPETAEPKKTKDKVKSSRSKKPMSLLADRAKSDRLFLGKQLPPGQ